MEPKQITIRGDVLLATLVQRIEELQSDTREAIRTKIYDEAHECAIARGELLRLITELKLNED